MKKKTIFLSSVLFIVIILLIALRLLGPEKTQASDPLVGSSNVVLTVTICEDPNNCPPNNNNNGGNNNGGGGGGGSNSNVVPTTATNNVVVRGMAYPGSKVTLLRDGQLVSSTQAGPDARFEIGLTNTVDGTFTFVVWAMDTKGVKSNLFPFTVTLTKGVTNVISGIFLPPSISVDKIQVRKGDPITVFGQSVPNSNISVLFNSAQEFVKNTYSKSDGLWFYKMDTLPLEYGNHTVKARTATESDFTSFSKSLGFTVGAENVVVSEKKENISDANNDGAVNLIDFSILLYWYKRPITQKTPEGIDLNKDGKVDLRDFSIMAYNWTG